MHEFYTLIFNTYVYTSIIYVCMCMKKKNEKKKIFFKNVIHKVLIDCSLNFYGVIYTTGSNINLVYYFN